MRGGLFLKLWSLEKFGPEIVGVEVQPAVVVSWWRWRVVCVNATSYRGGDPPFVLGRRTELGRRRERKGARSMEFAGIVNEGGREPWIGRLNGQKWSFRNVVAAAEGEICG